jgi:parallel beta-helix repeat protein
MGGLTLCVVSASAAGAVRKVPQKYPTIQAAVDAANPGDVIEISKKRNFEHVNVSTARLVIKGAKKGVIVDGNVEGLGVNHQFTVNANRVTIANLELRHGSGINCSGDRCTVRRVRSSGQLYASCVSASGDGVRVLNSRFSGCASVGIAVFGPNARVEGNRVQRAGNHCIAIDGSDGAILDNKVGNCGGVGVGIGGGTGALIRGNTVSRSYSDLLFADSPGARIINNKGSITLAACVRAWIDGGRVRGNRLSDCQEGASLQGAAPKVINNTIRASKGAGVQVHCTAECDGALVEGNVVRGTAGPDSHGFVLSAPPGTGGMLVRDNLAVDASGLAFILDIGGARVTGNTARSSGIPYVSAFLVQGDDNVVRRNRSIGNAGTGLQVEGSDNLIESNVLRKNHGDGINVNPGVTGNTLIRNEATGNKADGIENSGDDTVLRRNRASGNKRDCANDGTIAAKQKNRCADKSNFNLPGTVERGRQRSRD